MKKNTTSNSLRSAACARTETWLNSCPVFTVGEPTHWLWSIHHRKSFRERIIRGLMAPFAVNLDGFSKVFLHLSGINSFTIILLYRNCNDLLPLCISYKANLSGFIYKKGYLSPSGLFDNDIIQNKVFE
jgi:hypothetical protein